MYCIHCGNPIPENSKFCPQCGKEQTISKVETKTEVTTQEVISLSGIVFGWFYILDFF